MIYLYLIRNTLTSQDLRQLILPEEASRHHQRQSEEEQQPELRPSHLHPAALRQFAWFNGSSRSGLGSRRLITHRHTVGQHTMCKTAVLCISEGFPYLQLLQRRTLHLLPHVLEEEEEARDPCHLGHCSDLCCTQRYSPPDAPQARAGRITSDTEILLALSQRPRHLLTVTSATQRFLQPKGSVGSLSRSEAQTWTPCANVPSQ